MTQREVITEAMLQYGRTPFVLHMAKVFRYAFDLPSIFLSFCPLLQRPFLL
jgi:hypothetical protein